MIHNCKKAGAPLAASSRSASRACPMDSGTHTQWDKKLDGRLAQAVMAVQAMKEASEIGMGFEARADTRLTSPRPDPVPIPSKVHTRSLGFTRPETIAGGLEAGMTNSQPLGAARGHETDHARWPSR